MTTRVDLATVANRAGAASRIPGAPRLTAESTVAQLVGWFRWNDPNGAWTPCDTCQCAEDDEERTQCGECIACSPLTLDDAWAVLADMVADDIEEG